MPFLHFAKFLKSYSKKDLIHIKVIFNKTKIAEYTYFGKVLIKKVLPSIKNNRIYSVSLLFKEYGDYVETEISEYILFKKDDEIYFCQPVYKHGMIYLKEISDIKIDGPATKKIIVEEIKSKIYAVEIVGESKVKQEEQEKQKAKEKEEQQEKKEKQQEEKEEEQEKEEQNDDENIIFRKQLIMLTKNNKLDLGKIFRKQIQSKYIYDIIDMETDHEVTIDENLNLKSSKIFNQVRMVLSVKQKTLCERFFQMLKITKE
jgi:hypothetical protein